MTFPLVTEAKRLTPDSRPRPMAILRDGLAAGWREYPRLLLFGVLWAAPWYALADSTRLVHASGFVINRIIAALGDFEVGAATSCVVLWLDSDGHAGVLAVLGTVWQRTPMLLLLALVYAVTNTLVDATLQLGRVTAFGSTPAVWIHGVAQSVVGLAFSWLVFAPSLVGARGVPAFAALAGSVRMVRGCWWRVALTLLAGGIMFAILDNAQTLWITARANSITDVAGTLAMVKWIQRAARVLLTPFSRAVAAVLFMALVAKAEPFAPPVNPDDALPEAGF